MSLNAGAVLDQAAADVAGVKSSPEGPSLATQLDGSSHLIAWALTLIIAVGIIVLAGIGKPIPSALMTLAGFTGGSGAALSLPRR